MARGTWAWVRENGTYAYGQSATPSDVGSTELRAAIEAVRATPEGSEVHLRTDSRVTLTLIAPYAIITGFDLGGPTKFRPELVDEFAELAESREIIAHWVRGHSGDPLNHAADRLASLAADRLASLAADEGRIDYGSEVLQALRKFRRHAANDARRALDRECECGLVTAEARALSRRQEPVAIDRWWAREPIELIA
ncbi:hypothetical protein GCM10025867_50980 (plasmid) [Frondihabitans sucicola]|uniref:RNase H type-1 domain-containing protein n=2 Tax=Frondihabitans sucicola TaxID=1268041 RepID=A0ABM8GWL6_9MICO|nr:hypothetical protein GCM10025867_50980 [Frondihabitans sucicola]